MDKLQPLLSAPLLPLVRLALEDRLPALAAPIPLGRAPLPLGRQVSPFYHPGNNFKLLTSKKMTDSGQQTAVSRPLKQLAWTEYIRDPEVFCRIDSHLFLLVAQDSCSKLCCFRLALLWFSAYKQRPKGIIPQNEPGGIYGK